MKTGMNEAQRKKISKGLDRLLADTYALYLKTQNFHWNLKGPHFFSLHILFEKQYTEMAEAIDEIAERIQALGFFVDGSFSAFKSKSSIKEERKKIKARPMLQRLSNDHEALIRCCRELAKIAEEEGDAATNDLLARRLGAHEKFLWMLRSSL